MQQERWVIEISDGRYAFTKEINGSIDESYAPYARRKLQCSHQRLFKVFNHHVTFGVAINKLVEFYLD